MASSVFALWELRHETENESLSQPSAAATITTTEATLKKGGEVVVSVSAADVEIGENATPVTDPPRRTKVAFNGSVIEHYPRYRANCQAYLDGLLAEREPACAVDLVPAVESSLLGAAVALASALEVKA